MTKIIKRFRYWIPTEEKNHYVPSDNYEDTFEEFETKEEAIKMFVCLFDGNFYEDDDLIDNRLAKITYAEDGTAEYILDIPTDELIYDCFTEISVGEKKIRNILHDYMDYISYRDEIIKKYDFKYQDGLDTTPYVQYWSNSNGDKFIFGLGAINLKNNNNE